MKKTIILVALLLAVALPAAAQTWPAPCNMTIAAGQSVSEVFGVTNTDVAANIGAPIVATTCTGGVLEAAATPLAVWFPAALEAGTVYLQVFGCLDSAGATCAPIADKDGTDLKVTITGGATPTRTQPFDLQLVAPYRYFKFKTLDGASAAKVQTAARAFKIQVRPL
jgi:hypothetical protein